MLRSLLFAAATFAACAVTAAEWSSRLQGGGTVTVNPDTNRATVTKDGVTTQLWRGTHRLQDGSILIINRGGVAVPNESIVQSRQLPPPKTEEWQDVQIVGYSPCEKLVRRVCGKEDQCAGADACDPSRQLLAMEKGERDASDNRNLMSYTSGQCLKALRDDEFFLACRPGEDGTDTE
jgi:hypothetical protein